jgi:hypothetical protein
MPFRNLRHLRGKPNCLTFECALTRMDRVGGTEFWTGQKKLPITIQAEITRNIFRRLRASHSSRVSLIRLEYPPEPRG